MRALILAAGFGTRLRPFTENHAKPSLPVVGVPAFWYPAWHVARDLGAGDLALNVCHAAGSVRRAAQDADLLAKCRVHLKISDESSGILGSAGALRKLRGWAGATTLAVVNGDTICFPAWRRMLELHRKRRSPLTLHARAFSSSGEAYSGIEIGANGKVTGIGPKSRDGVMFDGCYLIEPEAIEALPDGPSELRPALLEPLIASGRLHAFREDIDWLDLGSAQSYAEAQFELLRRFPAARELVETKMRERGPGCWIPRRWDDASPMPRMTAPVVLAGEQEEWAASAPALGPFFAGVEPPPRGREFPVSRALVLSGHIHEME